MNWLTATNKYVKYSVPNKHINGSSPSSIGSSTRLDLKMVTLFNGS